MLFSIIIPVYNSEKFLFESINSALNQEKENRFLYEVIIVDDCSTDNSIKIAESFFPRDNYYILSTNKNSGPGTARNVGVNKSIGKYILFMDSDDCLVLNGLSKLHNTLSLNNSNYDLIGYNWRYLTDYKNKIQHSGGRRDVDCMLSKRGNLVDNYLSMKMDGSVIFTLIKRSLIMDNNIMFSSGYHEDIDYIFKLYYHADDIGYMNDEIYTKRNHSLSIMNNITTKHIIGYMRAWREIFNFICIKSSNQKELESNIFSFRSGLTGAIGNLIITIARINRQNPMHLFDCLYSQYTDNFVNNDATNIKYIYPLPKVTNYDKVSTCFITSMELGDADKVESLVFKCIKQYKSV
jgi:poly(ribitol-phosphate) beta-N-acetylglucosaminyltransferase